MTGVFTNIKPNKDLSKTAVKKSSKKSFKKKKEIAKLVCVEGILLSHTSVCVCFNLIFIDESDEYAFIDVLGDSCEDVTYFKEPVIESKAEVIEVEEPQPGMSLSLSLIHSFFHSIYWLEKKEEIVISTHIENILNFDGVCDEQPGILTIIPIASSSQKQEKNNDRRIKRHRSSRRHHNADGEEEVDEEESDDEDLRTKIARLNHHTKLEREYRDLQEEIHSQRLQIMERRLESLSKAVTETNKENQYLRRTINQQQRASISIVNNNSNNNNSSNTTNANTTTTTTTKRKTVAPRKKKYQTTQPQQQQSIDQFMQLAPYNPRQQQEEEVGEGAIVPMMMMTPIAMPVIDITQTPEFIAQQNAFIAQCEEEDRRAIALLTPFNSEGSYNIGVQFMHRYKLSGYLEVLLEAVRNPSRNDHVREVLNHPFINNYKITLLPNMSMTPSQFSNDREMMDYTTTQRNQVLDKQSPEVRRNLSQVLLHLWFLHKAIRYEEMADAGQLAYKPQIMRQFAHTYAPEILNDWYPYIDAGNNFIITADLKIPAKSIQHGQGHGKHCCYCDFQYIANSEGRLKFAHQVKNCDYLAEMSYDERVILTTVLEKRRASDEFNKHPFIAKYDQNSLLRRATPEEVAQGKYVAFQFEKLRINMRTFLSMRQRAYTRFLARIESLDIHDVNTEEKLKNLDAKPISHQLDCFYLTSSPPPQPSSPTATANKKNGKPTKSDNRPKKPSAAAIKSNERVKKTDGFLYKTLVDYNGEQFRKSKFGEGDKTRRDFTFNEETGFGDGMYFSCTYDPIPVRYATVNALPFEPAPLAEQVQNYLANQEIQRQQHLFAIPPPLLYLKDAGEEEQQQEEMAISYDIIMPHGQENTMTMEVESNIPDFFGAHVNRDDPNIWGTISVEQPIFGTFGYEDNNNNNNLGTGDFLFPNQDQGFGGEEEEDFSASFDSRFSKNRSSFLSYLNDF